MNNNLSLARKPIRFLGIRFRNNGHRTHFLTSVCATCISILSAVVTNSTYALGWCFVIYGLLCLTAIRKTKFGKKEDRDFSKDCIWWNGLISLINLAALILFYYFSSPKPPQQRAFVGPVCGGLFVA